MEEYIVHADSKNRNTKLYPKGNSYVLDVIHPISGVVRVDLISARVPNSMYNLTSNTSNIITQSSVSMNSFLQPGFYSANTLECEMNARIFTDYESMYYSQHEGKFYYLTNDPNGSISTNSSELAKMLGMDANKTYDVTPLNPPINSFYYAAKSERVVDFSLNEYVFLDIEEFRGPHFSDVSGGAENMFAVIPMDVYSGQVKTFKETSDYSISVNLSNRMMTLSKLTVRWYDKNLNLLNFQGFENNGFVLRVHTDRIVTPPKLPPPLNDVVVPPPPPPPTPQVVAKKSVFGKWSVFLGILGILVFWWYKKSM